MIVVLGQYDVRHEDTRAAASLMQTMVAETNKEPGCLHYAFAADLSAPDRFQLSEWWQDDAALSAHFQTAHMAAFRAGLGKLRIEKRTVKRFEVASVADLIVPSHSAATRL